MNLFLNYEAEQRYMVFHYCEIHETDAIMTKLHPAEDQFVVTIISKDFNEVTVGGIGDFGGNTLETPAPAVISNGVEDHLNEQVKHQYNSKTSFLKSLPKSCLFRVLL